MKIVITGRARREIDEAFDWIEKRSRSGAARWYERLRLAIGTLADKPARCPLAPENENFPMEIRQLLYGKRHGMYRILFTIEGSVVTVLRVRHAARETLQPDE